LLQTHIAAGQDSGQSGLKTENVLFFPSLLSSTRICPQELNAEKTRDSRQSSSYSASAFVRNLILPDNEGVTSITAQPRIYRSNQSVLFFGGRAPPRHACRPTA